MHGRWDHVFGRLDKKRRDPTFKYIGQLYKWLQLHKSQLAQQRAIVIGDLNSNPGVKFPPPLMVLGWWLVGFFIHLNVPVEIVSNEVSLWGWLACWDFGIEFAFCIA